jgi:DNA-binding MarR family transcriptional regulator
MTPRSTYLVGRLDRVLRRRLTEALAPTGLSLAEYTTLSVLGARGGLSNAQLARRSLITPQAMNEMLARLERRGLVRRRPDPDHGRVRRADLTPAGRGLLEQADAATAPVEQAMLAGLPAADRRRFGETLGAALRGLESPAKTPVSK